MQFTMAMRYLLEYNDLHTFGISTWIASRPISWWISNGDTMKHVVDIVTGTNIYVVNVQKVNI